MSNNQDGQGFDDWFAANFSDNPPPPKPPQPAAPAQPAAPQQHWAHTPTPPPVVPQQPLPPTITPQYPTQQQPMQPPADHWQPPLTVQQPEHPPFEPSLPGQDAVPTEFIPSANQAASGGGTGANALDALFGDDKFHDYETEPPTINTPGGEPTSGGDEPPKGVSRTHITLMWVAGSAVALFALFAFFIIGTKLPLLTGAGTSPSTEPTAPVETERPQGPVAPGTYNWNELLGGECLDDFTGAWENEYTVVDCSVPHDAQLVVRAPVPVLAGTGGAYPGVFDLQSRMNLLCTDVTVINYPAANNYDDVQFEASFPPNVEEWDTGRRDYFCFVSRASGDAIEGSLVAPPAPEEPATDESTEGD